MMNTIFTYGSFFTSSVNLIFPSPTGPCLGPGWDEVNTYISHWNNLYQGTNMYPRVCFRMCAVSIAIEDVSRHTGSLVELTSRAVAILSMIGYDSMGYGPVVGGLNGNNLNQSNVFASSGVQFQDVKSAMVEHLTERFRIYKILEQTVQVDNFPRYTWRV